MAHVCASILLAEERCPSLRGPSWRNVYQGLCFHVALTQVPLRALRGRIVDKPLRAREDGELILVVDDDLTPSNPDTMVGQIRQIPRQVFPRSTNM